MIKLLTIFAVSNIRYRPTQDSHSVYVMSPVEPTLVPGRRQDVDEVVALLVQHVRVIVDDYIVINTRLANDAVLFFTTPVDVVEL